MTLWLLKILWRGALVKVKFYLMRRSQILLHALLLLSSEDHIVDCSKDISDQLQRKYNSLLIKCGIENPRNIDKSVWQSDIVAFGANVPLHSGNKGL